MMIRLMDFDGKEKLIDDLMNLAEKEVTQNGR